MRTKQKKKENEAKAHKKWKGGLRKKEQFGNNDNEEHKEGRLSKKKSNIHAYIITYCLSTGN